ncbi:GTPase [Pseudomonas plecoglossicida]|uniref:DUF697 domain-containing protein n=1 Tax=Pseudomonas plecoglossicida TaxID=70775 RepID=A0AAD0VSC6_PSEDL|nr:GTPase [Pseudomonas plecoglossicida]AXM95278.1 DUF697 domain-containing protein [Pseudomonas plecoglossicida]EPB97510.1 GTPase [Pseudomonas plecoglossicida NB2011]QLB56027.1 DUF697 domain-containing protein [Pseudomonas plecoglossicida]
METAAPAIQDQIDDAIKNAVRGVGKVNIIIAGKTGVGKSTLINTVFRGELAKTGSGHPVTQRAEEISKPGHPITIIDTKGLELHDYEEIIGDLRNEINERSAEHDENKHIHAAWLCIHEDGRRIEDAEKQLCEMLAQKNIPVVVAITKSRSDNGFRDQVKAALPGAAAVVSVRALAEQFEDDGETFELKVKGINELITETSKLLPEAKQRAYANALNSRHAASTKLKIAQAEKEVNIAAAAAMAAGATPIPFSDSILLVPIQAGMLAKVGVTFGMETSAAALTTLVTSSLGASAATLAGRALVTGLLKMIPGVGTVAGGAIAGTAAAALTKTLGNTYISILTAFIENNPGKELDIDLIAMELKKKLSF